MFVSYQERNNILAQMGFLSYQEYRESELWKIIKKHVLERDYYYCRGKLCNNRSRTVHHFTYNRPTLEGQSPYTLITLCETCHRKVEFIGNKKRNFRDVQKATLELVTNTELLKGVSNPKVGRWFRNQFQMNIPVRNAIQKELGANHVSLSSL